MQIRFADSRPDGDYALVLAVPGKAQAGNGWVVPAVIAGGIAIWAISAANARAQYAPARRVYVRSGAKCRIVREHTPSGYRRVEVCG